jgi:hypothetical protein
MRFKKNKHGEHRVKKQNILSKNAAYSANCVALSLDKIPNHGEIRFVSHDTLLSEYQFGQA